MSDNDLSGKATRPPPEFHLNRWQKRQAMLLYHFASMDYLKGLKTLVDDFVNGVDITLDVAQRQGRDRFLVSERWGVRDTVANFNTYGFPALQEFQRSVSRGIALRATEFYDITGYNQCSRLLGELSLNWSTPEEEERFDAGMETIGKYRGPLDITMRRSWSDSLFNTYWRQFSALFPRWPRFRVRTDVEAESGRLPVRTGVYVPQNDPYGSLQFAWTGDSDGRLLDCSTFNALGLQAIAIVGREALWARDPRLLLVVQQPRYLTAFKARRNVAYTTEKDHLDDPGEADAFVSKAGVERRPCKWYYVERVEGEFEDPEPDPPPVDGRLRGEPGEFVPQTGVWRTLAIKGEQGVRHFERGDRFPETRTTAWGGVIWTFDPETQPESERIRMARELADEIARTGLAAAAASPVPDVATTIANSAPEPRAHEPGEPVAQPEATTSPDSPGAPQAPAVKRVPLGELAATGRACPQAGWWESVDEGEVQDGRRHLDAGEPMPHVLVSGKPTLWERLKNEGPIHRRATVWKLVAYDDSSGKEDEKSDESRKY